MTNTYRLTLGTKTTISYNKGVVLQTQRDQPQTEGRHRTRSYSQCVGAEESRKAASAISDGEARTVGNIGA